MKTIKRILNIVLILMLISTLFVLFVGVGAGVVSMFIVDPYWYGFIGILIALAMSFVCLGCVGVMFIFNKALAIYFGDVFGVRKVSKYIDIEE